MYRSPASPSPTPRQPRSPATVEEKLPDQILIGQRLLKTGLLSQAQIAQALREKKQNYLRVGEVCLDHGWITPDKLYSLLPSTSLGIGELLILRGDLTFGQLKQALAHQRKAADSDAKLGDVLVEQGNISAATLAEALDQQTQIREMFYLDAWQALQLAQVKIQFSATQAVNTTTYPEVEVKAGAASPHRSTHPEGLQIPNHLQGQSSAQPKTVRSRSRRSAEPDTAPGQGTPVVARSRQTAPTELSVLEAKYQSRIASLELQMDMQQREWQSLTEQMNQQVAEFHARYQERIAALEQQLQQHQQDQVPTLQQLQFYQQRVQNLEVEIANYQAQQRTDQTQILTLQTQLTQLETELKQCQEQRQREQGNLHQHYQRQLQETETLMQQQQHQADTQQSELQTRLQRAKECIDNLTLELADSYTTHDQEKKQLEDKLQEMEALAPRGAQYPIESTEVQEASELVKVYQQNLESMQQQLQAQQTQNRWLAARLIHLQDVSAFPHSSLATPPSSATVSITQPEPLLAALQEAALISEAQIQQVHELWAQEGGELAQILLTHLGISETTIAFLQDLLDGAPPPQHLAQALIAADLVTEADLMMIRQLYPSLPSDELGEALAEQGVIRPGTARYFTQRVQH